MIVKTHEDTITGGDSLKGRDNWDDNISLHQQGGVGVNILQSSTIRGLCKDGIVCRD
jgi:hypothetical protein